MVNENIHWECMSVSYGGCGKDEASFFDWFIRTFIHQMTELPENTSQLEAMREYGELSLGPSCLDA
jgi:hypothetical protein